MNPIELANRFVADAYPTAEVALLGGSLASGVATSTSDVDLVLLFPEGYPNFAETVLFDGRLVEVFAHTLASSDERDERRYTLSAAIDDLRGSLRPGESFAVQAQVFEASAELLLLNERVWLGKGKWLARQLEQLEIRSAVASSTGGVRGLHRLMSWLAWGLRCLTAQAGGFSTAISAGARPPSRVRIHLFRN